MQKEKIFRNYLISPRRGGYRDKLNPSDCIFCGVVRDLDKSTLPGIVNSVPVVAKFKHSILVVNLFPYVPKGHLMLVPVRHIVDTDEMKDEEIDETFKVLIPRVKAALNQAYPNVVGFNLGINIGKHAGASVEHLHLHILPRFANEAAFMETTASTRILDETAETTMTKLGKYF